MIDHEHTDFIAAMGEEFTEVLSPLSGDGADAFSVVVGVSPSPLTPQVLAAFGPEQIERLRVGFVRHFEIDDGALTTEQMTTAIARTLARWPVNESSDDASPGR